MADGAPNDIVILKLAEPVDMTNENVDVIVLPKKGEEFTGNENCWIMGWGLTCEIISKISFFSFLGREPGNEFFKGAFIRLKTFSTTISFPDS